MDIQLIAQIGPKQFNDLGLRSQGHPNMAIQRTTFNQHRMHIPPNIQIVSSLPPCHVFAKLYSIGASRGHLGIAVLNRGNREPQIRHDTRFDINLKTDWKGMSGKFDENGLQFSPRNSDYNNDRFLKSGWFLVAGSVVGNGNNTRDGQLTENFEGIVVVAQVVDIAEAI